MKINVAIYHLAIMGLLIISASSCKKNSIIDYTGQQGTVTDIDGNVYHTIGIGTQVWMVENMKTTKYNDGASIPLVTADSDWMNLSTPAYCWYNNDADSFKNTYGALYNFHAVRTGRLAPTGWHVASNDEWIKLSTYLGEYVVGGKLKETGTTHWQSPNEGATNESGFTALPGGVRYAWTLSETGKTFDGIGLEGWWWCSTEAHIPAGDYGWKRRLSYMYIDLSGNTEIMGVAMSVRCVKD